MNPIKDSLPALVSAKDFFLWAGAVVSLYWSVIAFINLFFDYIDRAFPDPLRVYYYVDISSSSVRFEMASLIVMVPLCLYLLHVIRKDSTVHPEKRTLWVRTWAQYLTLFVAGIAMAGSLIYVLNDFLSGSLATASLLKALVVMLTAAVGFMHFLADTWGYWNEYPQRARSVSYAVAALVLATIVSGFLIFGTPAQARLYRFDTQKVNDLQSIQSQVLSYWQQFGKLPANLETLNDPLSYSQIPVDPQPQYAYEYSFASSTHSFTLCATFNAETQDKVDSGASYSMMAAPTLGGGNDSWYHPAGHYCYSRTIDPKRFPVYDKSANAVPVPAPVQ